MSDELKNKLQILSLDSRVNMLRTMLTIIKGYTESQSMSDKEKLDGIIEIIETASFAIYK